MQTSSLTLKTLLPSLEQQHYTNILFWTRRLYKKFLGQMEGDTDGLATQKPKQGRLSKDAMDNRHLYLEDKHGKPVTSAQLHEFGEKFCRLLNSLKAQSLLRATWRELEDNVIDYIQITMEYDSALFTMDDVDIQVSVDILNADKQMTIDTVREVAMGNSLKLVDPLIDSTIHLNQIATQLPPASVLINTTLPSLTSQSMPVSLPPTSTTQISLPVSTQQFAQLPLTTASTTSALPSQSVPLPQTSSAAQISMPVSTPQYHTHPPPPLALTIPALPSKSVSKSAASTLSAQISASGSTVIFTQLLPNPLTPQTSSPLIPIQNTLMDVAQPSKKAKLTPLAVMGTSYTDKSWLLTLAAQSLTLNSTSSPSPQHLRRHLKPRQRAQ
ncbi:hypothetical protein C0992_003727 [Termitomyces sp. T32_za158]|nr:hypothetical protein C0992_003727 [Termitomyces sp. T32_za158]